jgi:hypothetical protein
MLLRLLVQNMLTRRRTMTDGTSTQTGILWRIILVVVGFGLASLGFVLVMTVFLSFIGLPLFIIGAALMQAQQSA